MGKFTLNCIAELIQKADPWNLAAFLKKARALQLNGVHLPFWRKYLFANPSIFLLPEILHACHHILPWCKELLGNELDTWSISGHVPPRFLRAIHALINFIYQAQSPVHTESSIQEMELSLHEFHDHKDTITEAGARRTKAAGAKTNFNILKLKLFHSFATAICNNGGLIQYTADVSERLLITHCKHLFDRMSKNKDFAEQVIQILDQEEVMQQFDVYTLLHSGDVLLVNAMCEDEIRTANPMLAWVTSVLPEEQWQIQGPCPVHNYFASGILASNAKTALHVTSRPDATNMLPNDIAMIYHLSDFEARYLEFLQLHSCDTQIHLAFNSITLWHKFHVQLHSTFHLAQIMPSQAVQAAPPLQDFPYGCCFCEVYWHNSKLDKSHK